MEKIGWVALGSALGGVLRYLLSTQVYRWLGQGFPYGTLVVNMLGCLLAGVLFSVLLQRVAGAADTLRALLMVGFLGGFTTFSSFSVETVALFENGASGRALLNIVVSVTVGLLLTSIGIILGRQG